MSQENVESLRAILRLWHPAEWARGEGMSLLDPECTYEDTVLPDHVGETYRGREGMSRALARWLEAFEEGLTVTLDRIIGSDDPLVAILRARGIARHTGIEIEAVYSCLFRFRGGKIIHMQTFLDPRQALEAAGLSE